MLDMNNSTHVPVHNSPDLCVECLKSISAWQDITDESIMDAIGSFDKLAGHIVPEAYSLQDSLGNGFIPALSAMTAGLFTRSKRILQQYARNRTMNATDLKAFIEEVLNHPEFNLDVVKADMHASFMRAVEVGDVEIHNMWQKGDGAQEPVRRSNYSSETWMMYCVNCWQT